MYMLVSPAKKMDLTPRTPVGQATMPIFASEIQDLIKLMKQHEPDDLSALMGISDGLAQLNFERYVEFDPKRFDESNSKQALFAFNGDVYQGLNAGTMTEEDCAFAQDHLGILSGLYGLISPLDFIQAYRLEMGVKLGNDHGKDLYAFWGDKITQAVNARLRTMSNPILLNLASNEYFKVITPKAIQGQLVKVDFKEYKNGQYKTIALFAKKARGLLARYIIDLQINDIVGIKNFNIEGYQFSNELSTENHLVFTRKRV